MENEEQQLHWKHRTKQSIVSISRKELLKYCKEQLQKEDQILHWLQHQEEQILQKQIINSSQGKKRSLSPVIAEERNHLKDDEEELILSQDLASITPIPKRRKLNETSSATPLQHITPLQNHALFKEDNSIEMVRKEFSSPQEAALFAAAAEQDEILNRFQDEKNDEIMPASPEIFSSNKSIHSEPDDNSHEASTLFSQELGSSPPPKPMVVTSDISPLKISPMMVEKEMRVVDLDDAEDDTSAVDDLQGDRPTSNNNSPKTPPLQHRPTNFSVKSPYSQNRVSNIAMILPSSPLFTSPTRPSPERKSLSPNHSTPLQQIAIFSNTSHLSTPEISPQKIQFPNKRLTKINEEYVLKLLTQFSVGSKILYISASLDEAKFIVTFTNEICILDISNYKQIYSLKTVHKKEYFSKAIFSAHQNCILISGYFTKENLDATSDNEETEFEHTIRVYSIADSDGMLQHELRPLCKFSIDTSISLSSKIIDFISQDNQLFVVTEDATCKRFSLDWNVSKVVSEHTLIHNLLDTYPCKLHYFTTEKNQKILLLFSSVQLGYWDIDTYTFKNVSATTITDRNSNNTFQVSEYLSHEGLEANEGGILLMSTFKENASGMVKCAKIFFHDKMNIAVKYFLHGMPRLPQSLVEAVKTEEISITKMYGEYISIGCKSGNVYIFNHKHHTLVALLVDLENHTISHVIYHKSMPIVVVTSTNTISVYHQT